jgi:hypothetical protein
VQFFVSHPPHRLRTYAMTDLDSNMQTARHCRWENYHGHWAS